MVRTRSENTTKNAFLCRGNVIGVDLKKIGGLGQFYERLSVTVKQIVLRPPTAKTRKHVF